MSIIEKKFSRDLYLARYLVDEEHEGMRLDQFLQIYLATFSREHVKEKIKNGEVVIENRHGKHKPNSKLHHKEVVQIKIFNTIQEDEYWNGKKLELEWEPEVIFENEGLYVISKPPYMATHPTGRHIFNCATVFFEAKNEKTVHSIHRIDRETSGVLLLGKNPKTANTFTEYFEEDRVKKCYFFIAIEKENKDNDKFSARERLGATETGLKRIYINAFPENSEDGKHAHTHFEILHREKGYALGLAFPQTGRQHQIRVHAMTHGLPLLGDKLYLGSFKMFQRFKDVIASKEDHELMEISRHALHALALNIPFENSRRTFSSNIPTDLKDWISEKLEVDIGKLELKIKEEIETYFKTLDK